MQEMASDELPERWHETWDTMKNARDGGTIESTGYNLQEWLEELYFDGSQRTDLTREDIARLGQIIGKLLRFEPSARASARQVLDDPWFNEYFAHDKRPFCRESAPEVGTHQRYIEYKFYSGLQN
jgi:serine/threonine protein kinase